MDIRLPALQAVLEMAAVGLASAAVLVGGLLLLGQLAAAAQRGAGTLAARLPGVIIGLTLAFFFAGALIASGSMISAAANEAFGRMPQVLGLK